LPADEFAQIAFEMEREIAGGISDARQDFPEGYVVGKGVQFLDQAGKVAAV
jgi:hypothetical protein